MDFRVLFYFIFLEFVGVVIVGIITFFFEKIYVVEFTLAQHH